MNDSILLSVIVPVYNTEKFLDKCIMSILMQTGINLELILIDDCSTDNSMNICQKYAKIDKRIIYHRFRENLGVSMARNFGIEESKGKYITFVDSDDYVDTNAYWKILKKVKNFEMIMFDMVDINCYSEKKVNKYDFIKENTNILKNKLNPDELFSIAGSVCRNIYLNRIIKENNLKFSVDIKLSEDRIFNLKYISYINKFVYIAEPLYFRMLTPDSTIYKYKKNMIDEMITSNLLLKDTVLKYWGIKYIQPYNYVFCLGYISCVRNILRQENKDSFFVKFRLINNFLNDTHVEETFSNCVEYSRFDIYRKKKIILIIMIEKLELFLMQKHYKYVDLVFGKMLSILYKL